MFGPDALGINNGYRVNAIESLYNEGYISGEIFAPSVGDIKGIAVKNMKITQKGIEFCRKMGR